MRRLPARSRGTPRIANRLLRRVRDYAQVKGDGTITKAVTDDALRMLEVDRLGLDKMDTMLLLTLIDKFAGGPVGVETLAAAIGEEKDTIEDVYEPFLIQAGFMQRTPRGRVATVAGLRSLRPASKETPARTAPRKKQQSSVLKVLTAVARNADSKSVGYGRIWQDADLSRIAFGDRRSDLLAGRQDCPGWDICPATLRSSAIALRSIFRSPLAS